MLVTSRTAQAPRPLSRVLIMSKKSVLMLPLMLCLLGANGSFTETLAQGQTHLIANGDSVFASRGWGERLAALRLLALVAAPVVNPNVVYAQSENFAVGSVKVTDPPGPGSGEVVQHIKFSAHSEADGTEPVGAVVFTFGSPGGPLNKARGKVVCLFVSGNVALITALLDEPYTRGETHLILRASDNGTPVLGLSPDLVGWNFTSTPPPFCRDFAGTITGESRGNVVVYDSTDTP